LLQPLERNLQIYGLTIPRRLGKVRGALRRRASHTSITPRVPRVPWLSPLHLGRKHALKSLILTSLLESCIHQCGNWSSINFNHLPNFPTSKQLSVLGRRQVFSACHYPAMRITRGCPATSLRGQWCSCLQMRLPLSGSSLSAI
jgi:hypothetical protein